MEMAHCPFCGASLDWGAGICEHLIADYGDGSDGDRGIMGDGNRTGNEALAGLAGVEAAVQALVGELGLEEAEGLGSEGASEVQGLLFEAGQEPAWWPDLKEDLETGGIGDGTFERMFEAAAPWGQDLQATSALLGGPMTTTSVSFIWAREPEAGKHSLQEAIGAMEAGIYAAAVEAKGWRREVAPGTLSTAP